MLVTISDDANRFPAADRPLPSVPADADAAPACLLTGPPGGPGWMEGMPAYDAFLLVSFGGPEGPDDVMPFLENVTRGRGIPPDRLASVAEHYYAVGGVSPINQQCRDMLTAVQADFSAAGLSLPLYWGNRNWSPYLTDTVRAMAGDGVQRAVAFVTSAYSSFSSCRQYLDDIDRARAEVGPGAPRIGKIRRFFNHPGFIEPFAANADAALATLPAAVRDEAHLVFTAHSVPAAMADASGPGGGQRYVAELTEAARLIAERSGGGSHRWTLAYQSRSGPPSQPWLEPDVCDHLAELAKSGTAAVVVIPVGFVSDHMEVRHDLDVEAAQSAESLGLAFARAATPGTSPRFASMITELVRERLALPDIPPGAPGNSAPGDRAALVTGGALGSIGMPDQDCPADCCRFGRPAASANRAGTVQGSAPA
jgi:ferrochelatase